MKYFIKKSDLIQVADKDFESHLDSLYKSTPYDGLLEVTVLGGVSATFTLKEFVDTKEIKK